MNRAERRRQEKLARKAARKPSASTEVLSYIQSGLSLHQSGAIAEALADYAKALALDENHFEALYLYGTALHQLGDPEGGIAHLTKAVAVKPDFPDALNNLGNAQRDLGQLSQALESYQSALRYQPDHALALQNAGFVYLDLGQIAEAKTKIKAAIQKSGETAMTVNALGQCFSAEKHQATAISYFEKAISLEPRTPQFHFNLGFALRDYGKSAEAIHAYEACLAIEPNHIEAANNIAVALQDIGDLEQAETWFRKALDLQPSYHPAAFNLAGIQLGKDDFEGAIESLAQALAVAPDSPEYQFFSSVVQDVSGGPNSLSPAPTLSEDCPAIVRAQWDAWTHLKPQLHPAARMTGSTIEAFRIGFDVAPAGGLVLEFGVRFGTSIRQLARLADGPVYGFDSFEGLPEDWGDEKRGSYTTDLDIPEVPDNVELFAGWFEDTLPAFLESHEGLVRLVNIDCDLYSSTKTILDALAPRVQSGTIMVFDEYIGTKTWQDDEYRAFHEAVERYSWDFEYLCYSFMSRQVAVRLL